ncbi:alpha,alpha-trehalase [Prolixibacteraceae bacterium JC049]|nr:alpha,alpha-trehalase [Prolixibacteraceae bacterium JC049]
MIRLFASKLLVLCMAVLCLGPNIYAQHAKTKPQLDKSLIPSPVFEENEGYVELYWKAWELAWEKVKYQEGIPQSPYMDEGLWDDTIWIWDTEFMVLFCRYAAQEYPGIESLQNFYKVLLDKEATSLRIQHPDNPPFYAWVEYEYYKFSNDKDHLKQLIAKDKYLQRHYNWFENIKPGTKLHFKHAHIALEKREKGYKWGGVQSGMDNTPRDYNTKGKMLWVDAIAQQALSALYISRLAKEIDEKAIAKEYQDRYQQLKDIVNENYWDEEDGFYYDILETDGSFVKVKTPASFWVLLAEIPSKKQAKRMAEYAFDPKHFGGDFPWPTLSKQEPYFNKELGDYWKGAIWLPTAYMATKSLEKYGLNQLANQLSESLLNHMYKTYKQYTPHTIWECYSPSKPTPSFRVFGEETERVREDFCGWSALGPISIFIENVLGFYNVDAQKNEVHWNLHHKKRHGIKGLRFGKVKADIVYANGEINVQSNEAFHLHVNGKKYKVHKGENRFRF